MFPEDDLRLEFWVFVRERAVDYRSCAVEPAATNTRHARASPPL